MLKDIIKETGLMPVFEWILERRWLVVLIALTVTVYVLVSAVLTIT